MESTRFEFQVKPQFIRMLVLNVLILVLLYDDFALTLNEKGFVNFRVFFSNINMIMLLFTNIDVDLRRKYLFHFGGDCFRC